MSLPMFTPPELLREIKARAARLKPELVRIRRDLHQHPELSGEESWTSTYLADYLQTLGLPVQTGIGGYGLVAEIIQDPNLPTVALRVDMDALPIHEVNQVSYRSQMPGVMHACGHDVHSAIGVGMAALFHNPGLFLPGNLRVIFQPEEEEVTGALRMIQAGVLQNPPPIAIFGLHVAPIPAGQIAWTEGLFLAGFDHYLASLVPQDGTEMPPEKLDALAQHCCQVIQSFNQWELPDTWQDMNSFWEHMKSGSRELRNFITYDASTDQEDPAAWQGKFGIGVKAANIHLRKAAIGRIKSTITTICQAAHTRFHLERVASMPDMRNQANLVWAILPALQHTLGSSNAIRLRAAFPFNCEDFAFYTKHIPGAMFWLGGANPDEEKFAMLHTPNFDVDETCLLTGTTAMAAVLVESLFAKSSEAKEVDN